MAFGITPFLVLIPGGIRTKKAPRPEMVDPGLCVGVLQESPQGGNVDPQGRAISSTAAAEHRSGTPTKPQFLAGRGQAVACAFDAAAAAIPAYDPRECARRRGRACQHEAPVAALPRRRAFAVGGGSLTAGRLENRPSRRWATWVSLSTACGTGRACCLFDLWSAFQNRARHRHKSMGCNGVQGFGPCQKARGAFCRPYTRFFRAGHARGVA